MSGYNDKDDDEEDEGKAISHVWSGFSPRWDYATAAVLAGSDDAMMVSYSMTSMMMMMVMMMMMLK